MNYEFPTLTADQISVKVKQVTAAGAVALLYKSARVDMDLLDKYVGPGKWECDYKEIKGNLYCGIGIYDDERGALVWKWDCGIESAQDDGNEKKAEASDAFKRAGFRWGIGRELYSAPFIFLKVPTKAKQGGKGYELADKFQRFAVSEIAYDDDRKISKLVIVDEKTGAAAYTYGAQGGQKPAEKPQKPAEAQKLATAEQLTRIKNLFSEERVMGMLRFYKINETAELTYAKAEEIIEKELRFRERRAYAEATDPNLNDNTMMRR